MEEIEFGEKLKRKREEKGMTQQTLADKLYVTRQAVSRWECGARFPDLMTAKKIAMELDTTIDELVSGEAWKRDIEKEQVLRTPVSSFIQIALYAAALIPYLFMCLFSIRTLFPDEALKGTPAGEVTAVTLAIVLSYAIGMGAMGCGLYYSIRNELSPARIGVIMSMVFWKEVLVALASMADILTKGNGIIGIEGGLAFLYQLLAPFLVIGFFAGKKRVPVIAVYIVALLSGWNVLEGIRSMLIFTTDLGYVVRTVRVFGEVAVVVLLSYQAHILNKKRKANRENAT